MKYTQNKGGMKIRRLRSKIVRRRNAASSQKADFVYVSLPNNAKQLLTSLTSACRGNTSICSGESPTQST